MKSTIGFNSNKSARTLRTVTSILFIFAASVFSGCMKGERGDRGDNGASGRITSTINCQGTVSGVSGTAGASLNGLEIEYNAVLTTGGDVYASAAIINETHQTSGTAFWAAGQSGADTAKVVVTDDYVGTANGAVWDISLDRNTLITSVVYDDPSLSAPIDMTFTASACRVQNW